VHPEVEVAAVRKCVCVGVGVRGCRCGCGGGNVWLWRKDEQWLPTTVVFTERLCVNALVGGDQGSAGWLTYSQEDRVVVERVGGEARRVPD
jgi:hypothetical protein